MLHRRRQQAVACEDDDSAEPLAPLLPGRSLQPGTTAIFDAKPIRSELQVDTNVSNAHGRFFVAVLEWHPSQPARWGLMQTPPPAAKDAVASVHGILSAVFDQKMFALERSMRSHKGSSVIGFALMRSWSLTKVQAPNALDVAINNVLDNIFQHRRSSAPRCTVRHEVIQTVLLEKPLLLVDGDKSSPKDLWYSCKDGRGANIKNRETVECFMFT